MARHRELDDAFLSPPVAMSAYYLKQAVRQWNLATIYRGVADFMVIQVIAVALVLIFPQICDMVPELAAGAHEGRAAEGREHLSAGKA